MPTERYCGDCGHHWDEINPNEECPECERLNANEPALTDPYLQHKSKGGYPTKEAAPAECQHDGQFYGDGRCVKCNKLIHKPPESVDWDYCPKCKSHLDVDGFCFECKHQYEKVDWKAKYTELKEWNDKHLKQFDEDSAEFIKTFEENKKWEAKYHKRVELYDQQICRFTDHNIRLIELNTKLEEQVTILKCKIADLVMKEQADE